MFGVATVTPITLSATTETLDGSRCESRERTFRSAAFRRLYSASSQRGYSAACCPALWSRAMMRRQNRTALAAAVLWATVAWLPSRKAADRLPPDTAKALESAAKSSNSAAFRTVLRRAIAAEPDRGEAILRAVMGT